MLLTARGGVGWGGDVRKDNNINGMRGKAGCWPHLFLRVRVLIAVSPSKAIYRVDRPFGCGCECGFGDPQDFIFFCCNIFLPYIEE